MVGNANAAFLDQTGSRLPALSDQSYVLAVGDVDGVNGPDMLTANNGQSRMLINNGAGVFADETGARIPSLSAATIAAKFVNVDGDGDLDLILINVSGPNVLLINDGTGKFTDESSSRLPPDTGVGTDVAVGDVDGNGSPDIAIAQRDGQNQLLINNGSGFFTDQTSTRLPADADPSYGVLLVDANGNGALDLFVANHEAQNRLYINNALGVFSDATTTNLPALQDGGLAAAAADVDGDRDMDIVVAAGADGAKLLVNNGGVFAAGALPAASEFAIDVAVGDIDFDGTTDIAVANAGQDRILLKTGAGIFTDATLAMLPADDQRSFGNALFDAEGDFDLDLVVATPGGQNRFFTNDIQVPRVRISIAPDFIEETDPVTITVESFDEDGIASTVVTVDGPGGTVGHVVTLSGGVGTFTPPAFGVFTVTALVTDNASNPTTRSVSFTALEKDLTPPVVTLSISDASPISGQTVELDVVAVDPSAGVISSGIASTSLTINGANVPLDSSGHASFVTSAAGLHSVVATANDNSGNTGMDTGSFTVLADAIDPVITTLTALPSPVDITNPVTINVSASDNVLVSSLTATVTERDPDGGGPEAPVPINVVVALDGSGQGSYTPYLPGTYTVEAVALDPSANSTTQTTTFVAVGDPDITLPVVGINITPPNVAIGNSVTITVTATDDILVETVSLEINGTPVALGVDNSVVFTPPVIGAYTVNASAFDPTGNEGTATADFNAVDPASDTVFPTVAITTPADDAPVTERVDVIGTATDLTFISYTLSVAPVGTTDYTELTTGAAPVVDGVLGSFDPTQLKNGFHELRLSATDINGRTSIATSVVSVAGALKLGQFAVSFLDKAIDIGKLPLEVTREYDSRQRNVKGDFGYGWAVNLSSATLTENRSPSQNWTVQGLGGFIPQYALVPSRPHTASIKFTEDDDIKFRARPNPEQQFFEYEIMNGMDYVAIGDTEGTLTPSSHPDWFLFGEVMTFDFLPYDPTSFTYAAEDGFVYRFTETTARSLRHKLTRITNPSGTTIDLTPNGFVRSDGLSLTFVRDGEGRITSVTDPRGNSIIYEYDVAGDLVAVTDPEGNRSTFVYDSNHFLLEIRDPLGRPTQRQEYDADGRLIAITDSAGNRIEMEYDIGANTQIVRDRRGNPTIYEYDSRGNVMRQTEFPEIDGVVTAIETLRTYDADNQLTSETDANTVVTELTYDTKGNMLTKTRDVGGLNLTSSFTYDAKSRVLTDTDLRGNTVTNVYDSSGNRTSRTARDGTTTGFTRNAKGQVSRETDALGNYTEYTYDSIGRKTAEERYELGGTLVRRKEFTYDANGNKLTETVLTTIGGVPTPLTTTFTYNMNDQVTSETDPLGNTKSIEYDALGKKSAGINALLKRTEFTRDARGNITRTDFPDTTFQLTDYDLDGNKASTTDRNSNVTTYHYDALDRLTRIEFADLTSRTKAYDAAGNIIGEIDEIGNRTDHTYDAVGRRQTTLQPEVFDAASATLLRPLTHYEYDENGNRTALVDALGARTEFTYDEENRNTGKLFPDTKTETITYDFVGNKIAKTDAAGLTTNFEYDALNRLVLVRLPKPTALDARPETAYEYDEAGRLIRQTDANSNVTEFTYDDAGRKTGRTLPGGQSETFGYDAAGRMTSHVDLNSDTTLRTYDDVDRVTLVEYADATSVATTYTNAGKPALVTDSRGDTTYTYDARNRLLTRTDPTSGTVSYAYNPTGRQASVTGAGGATTSTYDALNRLATSTDPDGGTTSYQYDAIGNLATVTQPNGTVTVNSYNIRDQLTNVTTLHSGGAVLSSHAYTLDPDGLRTKVVELGGDAVDYVYDDNLRLTRETRTGANAFDTTYTYDAVGNRTGINRDGGVTTYTYDTNDRLTQTAMGAGTTTYSYDGNGRLTGTNDGLNVNVYEYNKPGRLVRHVAPGGAVTLYQYDASGSRVSKQTAAGTTEFLVDVRSNTGVKQVIEERDAGGVLLVQYSHGLNLNSQDRGGASRSYYHYDGLGSTRLLTDSTEAVTDTYKFDAYGRPIATTGATTNRYLFAGERFDPNVAFYYLRARYYDQNTGRFISMDPESGDPQSPMSLHRYLYANNNPVNFIDPTGRFSLVSISISISISTNLRSVYTQNLVKFFIKALKIAYCVLEPAYKLQALGFDMMASNLPGGTLIALKGRDMIAGGFQALGSEIGAFYENVANDLVSIDVEVGGLLGDLIDSYNDAVTDPVAAVPWPPDLAQLIEFKEQLSGFMGDFSDALSVVNDLQSGDNCAAFTTIAEHADDIAGLIPDF